MTWHSTLSLEHGPRGPIPKLCREQSLGRYKIAELLAAPMIRSRGRNSRGSTRKACVRKNMKTKVEGSVMQHYLSTCFVYSEFARTSGWLLACTLHFIIDSESNPALCWEYITAP